MYKVYCDNNMLLSLTVEAYKLIGAVLNLELNKTGSFKFTIYPNHPNYNKLVKMKSIITVYQNNELIFRGRILNDSLGFHNEKQVTCEGELAFLVDSIQRPYDFQSGSNHTTVKDLFTYFITNHNNQVGPEHRFKVGNITVTDPNNYIVREDSTYMNTWDSINKKLIDSYGGYLWVRHETDGNYIDYLQDFNRLSNQTIEFGKNLLDISQITKGDDVASALIPLGAKIVDETGTETEKRLDITAVNGGVDYIYNDEAVAAYGHIYKVQIWDDVTDASNLLRKARTALGEAINLAKSIDLSAVDLAALKQNFNAFRLGTYIKVISKPHNINANFLVSKLTLNLMDPKSNKLTLGRSFASFTEKTQNTAKGEKGDPGAPGKDGAGGAVQSTEEPADTSFLWLDISKDPAVLKRYNPDTNSWDIVSDMSKIPEAIQQSEERTSSQIEQSSNAIISTVTDNYYLKTETDALVSSLQSSMSQTASGFEMQFNQFNANLNDILNNTDAQFREISRYIRFENGNIILGEAGNELTLKIQNDRISFIQNNNEVAYFTDKKLYVTDGEFMNSLQLGKFAFLPRSSGNLSFKKVIN